jgi:hypothetical protein
MARIRRLTPKTGGGSSPPRTIGPNARPHLQLAKVSKRLDAVYHLVIGSRPIPGEAAPCICLFIFRRALPKKRIKPVQMEVPIIIGTGCRGQGHQLPPFCTTLMFPFRSSRASSIRPRLETLPFNRRLSSKSSRVMLARTSAC